MKSYLVVIVFLFGGAAQAETVAINFNALPFGLTGDLSVSSQGFNFSSQAEFIVNGSVDDKALWYCPYCSVTMVNESSQLFDLQSFDFVLIFGSAGTVSVTGFYGAGGTVSTSLAVDTTVDNYLFDDSWAGLNQLVIATPIGAGPDYVGSLDNVTVNTVPIPGVVWLFGSALAGLAGLRRTMAA